MNEDILIQLVHAAERIADALEKRDTKGQQPVVVNLDGRAISQQVLRYTLRNASRSVGSLVGGNLTTGKPKEKK